MLTYVIKRSVFVLYAFIGVLTLVFFISRVIPGDPAMIIAGPQATPDQIENIRHKLGFDKPVVNQYLLYLKDMLFKGDLGMSVYTQRPVTRELLERFPATFELTTIAFLLATIGSLVLGVIASTRWGSFIDEVIRVFTIAGISFPRFWLAIMFQFIFFYMLGLLPAWGRISSALEPPSYITGMYVVDSILEGNFVKLFSSLQHLILPAFVLALGVLAQLTRIVRSSMLQILSEDYITKARAIGLKEYLVIYKHALRNALLPVITAAGMYYGSLLGGSVLIETVFSIKGMGLYMYKTIIQTDFNGIIGVTVAFAGGFLMLNFIVDLLYSVIDPRIHYE